MKSSIDAMFTSIVLETWIYFEAFAADLWTAALDGCTQDMAVKVWMNKEWKKKDEGLSAEDVYKLKFDPRSQLGSFLREIGRVSFQSLSKIAKNFAAVFGELKTKDFEKDIILLSAFRNCIAHRAGVVDKEFVNSVERFQEMAHLKSGDKIQLDGALVLRLREGAITTALALLAQVDDALAKSTPQEKE